MTPIPTLHTDLDSSGTITPAPVVARLRDSYLSARQRAHTLHADAVAARACALAALAVSSQQIAPDQPITDRSHAYLARSIARSTAREAARIAADLEVDAEVATRQAAHHYWRWYDAQQQVSSLRTAIAGDPAPTPAIELLLTRLAGAHVLALDPLASPAQQ